MGDLGSGTEKRSEVETLFGAPAEPQFDRITKLGQSHFGVDGALFTLLDDDRFWYKSRQGLSANGRDHAFSMCRHALERDDVLVFPQPDEPSPSPSADSDAPIWRSPQKTYVGRSIRAPTGDKIGTLCMTHGCKRALTSAELAEFDDFACLLEGALQNRIVSSTLAELASELDVARREALLDPLAQVWNRRGLDVIGGKLVAQARRNARPLAVAMIDIDHFKSFNDTHGHAAGAAALKELGADLAALHFDVRAALQASDETGDVREPVFAESRRVRRGPRHDAHHHRRSDSAMDATYLGIRLQLSLLLTSFILEPNNRQFEHTYARSYSCSTCAPLLSPFCATRVPLLPRFHPAPVAPPLLHLRTSCWACTFHESSSPLPQPSPGANQPLNSNFPQSYNIHRYTIYP